MAITHAPKEVIYLIDIFMKLGIPTTSNITVYNDNASALKLAKNSVYHSRTKHIAIRHHFIRKILQEGKFQLKYMCTEDMQMY